MTARRFSSLPAGRDRPRRREHPIRPPGEHVAEEPVDESVRALRTDPDYRALVDRVERRAGGKCELRIPGRCRFYGTDPHHVFPTSEGGPVNCGEAWLRWACRPCHQFVDDPANRDHAAELGHITPRHRKASP